MTRALLSKWTRGRPARFSDSTVVITAGGDVSRFVEPGTGEMTARIRYVGNSPRLQFSVNADYAVWRLSN